MDLVKLLGTLVDSQNNILVPGISDTVAPLTEEEAKTYDPIDFDMEVSSALRVADGRAFFSGYSQQKSSRPHLRSTARTLV